MTLNFAAKLPLVWGSGVDLLVLCSWGGGQGSYGGRCGFFGHGTFHPNEVVAGELTNEIETVQRLLCGPGTEVVVDGVSATDSRVTFQVAVTTFRGTPKGPDEVDGGFLCSGKADQTTTRFPIQFEVDGRRIWRVTPLPRDALDARR